jgi:membrane fusion protein, multidrug efflux system
MQRNERRSPIRSRPPKAHLGLFYLVLCSPLWLPTVLAVFALLSPATGENAPPAVGVISVRLDNVAPRADFIGRVEAINAVDIRTRIEDFIKERPFNEGQDVNQGQDLFLIEREGYEAALSAAQAALAGAEADLRETEGRFQRNQQLRENQTVSQATFEEAAAARDRS